MTLGVGARLGCYDIVEPLGAGGMGEVYRAHDSKLGRDVAIKVLPADLADNPEALARFEREAKVVAQLSHPNILAIHDFGREGQTAYAVMELLEGETLRARLGPGALSARKAVDFAVQIAEGLAAAHRKGVVHRDLKPENIFVTHGERVKLLDFGLARREVPGGVPDACDPTQSQHTAVGTVLGTAGYMSPEQVRGETVDHRSDIFSFGAVLYEMLAGRRAFVRETAVESMTAILKEDPPEIAATSPGPSPALVSIVQHCLEKTPEERFQSATDIAFALRSLSGSTVPNGPAVAVARRRLRSWLIPIVIAVALGVVGVASFRTGRETQRRLAEAVTFREMTFRPQAIFQAGFAPDGATIVYSAALQGNIPEIFTIRPEYPEAVALGLQDTHLLSVSSKGELAVLTNARYYNFRMFIGTLARVPFGSTAPREIMEGVRQADWSPDGSELAVIHEVEGKDRLEFPIGKVLYETTGYLSDLRVSPRGDRIAMFEHPSKYDDGGSVIVVDRVRKRTVLSAQHISGEGLCWTRAGDEVLFTASSLGTSATLYAADLSGHRRVVLSSAGGLTVHDISATGSLLVTRDDLRGEISVLAPQATAERDLSWLDQAMMPDLTRDGRMMLFTNSSALTGPNYDVCVRSTDGGPVTRLGEGASKGFSPDEKWALAVTLAPPQLVLYPIGPGESRTLPRGNLEAYHGAATWFPNGKNVLFVANEAGKALRCYMQDISGGMPRPVTPEGTSNCRPSRDGLRILFSKADTTWFIQPLGGGTAEAVSGIAPEDRVIGWSPDGRALRLVNGKNLPARIEQMDLASGRREPMLEIAPADWTGILTIWNAVLTDDARSYAYDYYRMRSHLFVVEGAR